MKLPYPNQVTTIAILKSVFGLTLTQEIRHYYKLSDRLLNCHGDEYTVKYLKDLYTQAITYVTACQIHIIPFRKTDRNGLVKDLRPLRHLLKGNRDEIRAGLTILRLCYLFYRQPKPDLKSIMSDGGRWHVDFLIGLLFKEFVSKVPKEEIQGSIKVIPRARAGPNGRSSLMSSHLDAVALTQRPKLLDPLHKLAEFIQPGFNLKEWIEHLNSWVQSNDLHKEGPLPISRLAALAEGGHKTRVIAIGDLFSQAVLLPIHKKLMNRLRDIRVDGTWDQSKSVSLVKIMSEKGPLYSYDLTNATDRFPVFLQEIVIAALFGEEVSALWVKVMQSERDFSFNDGKTVTKGIYYKRGQGMGLYSSWPAFALTHHYFVRFCASLIGIESFQDYTIIGDDVVIGNKRVAMVYRKMLDDLEVPISSSKSLLSEVSPFSAEICKRIIRGGEDLSPIPVDLIQGIGKSITLIPTFLDEIHNRYGFGINFPTWSPLLELKDLYQGSKQKQALILLTAPTFYARVGVQPLYGNIDGSVVASLNKTHAPDQEGWWPWLEIDPEILLDLSIVHDQMRKVFIMREYETVFRDWNVCFESPPTVRTLRDHEAVTLDSRHPFWSAHTHVKEIISSFSGMRISILSREDEFSFEEIGIRFAIDPTLRPFRERKVERSRITSHLTLDVFKVLKGELKYPEIKHPEGGLLQEWTAFTAH